MKKLHLSCLHNALISVSGLFFVLFACEPARAMETGTFEPPSLDGYSFFEEKLLDKDEKEDGDGVKETKLEIYRNLLGQRIGRYTCNGRTYAWGVKSNNNREDAVNNYTIRDSVGMGHFDERYGGNERTYAPAYCR